MFRLFLAVVCLSNSMSAAHADYCSSEAYAIVNAHGGNNLALLRSDVNGWGVNAFGYVSYIYQLGNKECYLSFSVKGTYFGNLCDQSFGFGGDTGRPNCAALGTWSNRYRR